MPSVTLKYGSTSRTFSRALLVKGFIPTDGQIQFPDLKPVLLDGSRTKKQAAFRRFFTVDLGIITDPEELLFIGNFLNSETQYITSSYPQAATAIAISSATVGGSGETSYVQVNTASAHGLSAGNTVRIAGCEIISPTFSGDYTVDTTVDEDTFRVVVGEGYSSHAGDGGTMQNMSRVVTETELAVVDMHSEFEAEWIDGVEIGRRIVLKLEEATARTTWP